MEKITLAELDINYQDVLKAMVDTKNAMKVTKESTIELLAEQQKLEAQGKKGSAQWEEVSRKIETNNVSLKGLSAEYTANQKVMTANLFTKNAELGTLEKLANRNKELRVSLRGLNLETEDGKKKQQEYIAEIDRNTTFIKANSDAQTKQFMNVGNYPVFSKAANAVKGFGTQLFALTGITAGVAGGIKLLQGIIGSTNSGAENLEFTIAGLKEGMSFLGRSISNLDFTNLVSGFREAYQEGKRYAEALDAIDDLQGALGLQKKDIETDIIRQRIIAKNRKLDLADREAAIAEIVRLEELKLTETQKINDKALDNVLINAESIVKADRKAIVDFIQNADDFQAKKEEMIALDKKLRESATTTEFITTKAGGTVQTSTFNTKAYAKAVSELSAEEQRFIEFLKIDNALTGDSASGVRGNIIKALGNQKDAVNELASSEEGLVRLKNSLYNELIKEEKAIESTAKSAEDASEKKQKAYEEYLETVMRVEDEAAIAAKEKAEERAKIIEEGILLEMEAEDRLSEWKKEKALMDAENQLQADIALNEDRFEVQRMQLERNRELELSEAERTGADLGLINQKYTNFNIQLAKEEQRAKMAIYSGFAGAISQLFGENTAVGRIAAVAQATINTYQGATAAFAQTPGGVGIKTVAAATAVASGLASVKKILSVKSGLPGDSGKGAGTVPGAGATSAFGVNPSTATNYYDSVDAMKKAIRDTPPVLILEDFQRANQRAIAPKEAAAL